jgi:hypothetical protein
MFSDPGFQIRIGKKEGVYRLTISKTLTNVLPRIVAKAHNWIQFPNNENTIHEGPATSLEQSTVHSCTHVPILKPSHHGDEYVSRKGYCSIHAQA